ncbi:MAG: HAD family hydrolase [Firmicutes bacterium]|nr:HAD family hydrolase [Bacillota bacterium]
MAMAIEQIKAVFIDLGDAIMIEETEIKDDEQTTLRAEIYPGMGDALRQLKEWEYLLALVADTRPGTYRNVLRQHAIYELFDVFAISEELGTSKPDPRMFRFALDKLQLEPEVVAMCGNNLARDIAGANALGMVSVWTHWNYRYPTTPRSELEVPDYTVRSAEQLLDLFKRDS